VPHRSKKIANLLGKVRESLKTQHVQHHVQQ
jgi:hypothetical protein